MKTRFHAFRHQAWRSVFFYIIKSNHYASISELAHGLLLPKYKTKSNKTNNKHFNKKGNQT